ncbi:invasion associated locus B family protein [Maritalea sp. S77]|jgi:invasion protein IalB|uniref:invasion associated locus B family protein n=1 Tax=Maritalea sp. S77 TaxID=3415125 RepID=UPI003C7E6A2F
MFDIFKSGAKLAAAGMLVMSLAGGALAQDSGQQQERKPEDNWLKVCDKLSSGDLACIVRQVVFKGGNKVGAFTLRDDPSGENRYLAIAEMPLAVLLPFGLTWQVDNTKPIRMPFVTCDPTKCTGQLVVNEAFIGALKRGAKLKLSAKNRANKDLVVDVNLSGFTAVYEGDTYFTPAEFQAQSTGQNALEQQLQGVAEELRKEKSGEGSDQPAENTGN